MKQIKKTAIYIIVFLILISFNIASSDLVEKMNKTDISVMCESKEFVLGGDSVGIKILSSGVLVMKSNREDLELDVGDVILQVNGETINTSEALQEYAKNSFGQPLNLKVLKQNKEKYIKVIPIFDDISKEYKLDIWVKDSTAGVGTITFYEKNSNMFAGLGHAITETTENKIVPIQTGAITFTDIYSVKKGYANEPGEVRGTITNKVIGSIITNTNKGIYGHLSDESYTLNNEIIEIMPKEKIKEKEAYIYSSVNYGNKEYYEIKIEKVLLNSEGNKNMLIKVTDERLLNLTGGIIQGMSGSPIVQDGKLIGAVTHVLLNDPTTGYGVFIENMLEDMENIKD